MPCLSFAGDKILIIMTQLHHVGKSSSGSDEVERHEDKLLAGHNCTTRDETREIHMRINCLQVTTRDEIHKTRSLARQHRADDGS